MRGSKFARRSLALGLCVVAMSACQSDPQGSAPPPTRSARSRLLANDVTPCFADATPVGFTWSQSPGTVRGLAQTLGVQVTSHLPAPFDVEIDILASGLGGMEIRIPWGTLTGFEAGHVEPVSFSVANIPIRSHGAAATVRLAAHYDDFDGRQEIVSPPLVFEFDGALQNLTVLPEEGPRPTTGEPSDVFPLDVDGNPIITTEGALDLLVPRATAAVTGKFAEDGVTFLNWNQPAGLKTTVGLRDRWAKVYSEILDNLVEIGPSYGEQYVCFQSVVGWVDENRKVGGQSESVRSTDRRFPARYHWVTILPIQNEHIQQLPIFNGPLNEHGCVELPQLTAGTYTIWTFNRLEKGSTDVRVYDRVRHNDDPFAYSLDGTFIHPADTYPLGDSTSVVVGSDGWLPSDIPLGNLSYRASSVTATYGQALFATDSGFLPNRVYRAFSNEQCPPTDALDEPGRLEACFSSNAKTFDDNQGRPVTFPAAVYLGYDFSALPGSAGHNADWKYVTAHEIGHQVQHEAMGSWSFSYDRVDSSFPQLCGCGGLNPTGNTLHCLQSSERQGAAQLEGYAHYFAANTWNSRADAECVFTYYKGFRKPDLTIDQPPAARSCRTAARWGETYCPVADRATEYDWLGFYTATVRGSDALSHDDLSRVYKRTCTGNPNTNCGSQTSTWAGLEAAARSEFGLGSPKAVNFEFEGDAYGVTR